MISHKQIHLSPEIMANQKYTKKIVQIDQSKFSRNMSLPLYDCDFIEKIKKLCAPRPKSDKFWTSMLNESWYFLSRSAKKKSPLDFLFWHSVVMNY